MAEARVSARSPRVFKLWPEGVPNQLYPPASRQTDGKRYWSIHDPDLCVFPAAEPVAGAPLILVIPGGGYRRISWLNGGLRVARWLNRAGITAAVLRYRLFEYDYPSQLQDAQRALRILRQRAGEWGGRSDNIGVVGASAGGHLAAHLATAWDLDTGLVDDPFAPTSARPDFQILLYPVVTGHDPHAHQDSRRNVLGENPTPEQLAAFSVESLVRPSTPPAFIVATAQDKIVPVENSLMLHRALRDAAVPADLHLYDEGAHGFGVQQSDLPVSGWRNLAIQWMRHHKFLPAPAPTQR